MNIDKALAHASFATALGGQLLERAEELLDFRLHSMERECAEGWTSVYASEVWFKENLPPPPLNDAGRRIALEMLKQEVGAGTYVSTHLLEFLTSASARVGYRSHLAVGTLEVEGKASESEGPWDMVANEVTRQLVLEKNRHFRFEITRLREEQWCKALHRGTRTPEPLFSDVSDQMPVPVRDHSRARELDSQYWLAVYALPFKRVMDPAGVMKPDWIVRLMADIAADFPFDKSSSSRSTLSFVQEGDGPWAWAIQFRKNPTWFGPRPKLALVSRGRPTVANESPTLPAGLLEPPGFPLDMSPRGIECGLMYWLPRCRQIAALLVPAVDAAVAAVAASE
jgi:hypothetical protein